MDKQAGGGLSFLEKVSQLRTAAARWRAGSGRAVCFGQMYYTETVVRQCQGSGGG